MDGINVLTHQLNPDMNSRGAQVGLNHILESKTQYDAKLVSNFSLLPGTTLPRVVE